MSFDLAEAERSLVDVVDLLNGDRRVGMGVRLDGAIVTSCRCLPRPRGDVVLPDPDAPGVLVLVRVRQRGSARVASMIVTAADPCSGLALLQAESIAGATVPDELNPALSAAELLDGVWPAQPDLAPRADGPVLLCDGERGWIVGSARSTAISVEGRGSLLSPALLGAPVFGEDGRVLGIVTHVDEAGREAKMALLSDHLPGWAVRGAPHGGANHGMAFYREWTERAAVEVLWGSVGEHAAGLGVRLLPDLLATSCRCLPHIGGKARLPSADDPGADPVAVRVRDPRTGAVALAEVVAAEPCADYALLAAPPPASRPLPAAGTNARFEQLVEELTPAVLDRSPAHDLAVLIYTHERRWIEGTATATTVEPMLPSDRLVSRSAGAPVFDRRGRLVGLVAYSDVRQPTASICRFADRLPGWVLRKASEAEEGQDRWRRTR